MKKLLYIDACIRDNESRTKLIAEPIIEALRKQYDVDTICINDLNLLIVQKDEINRRLNGIISDEIISWATKIKEADRIVISSPFWDMSIPSALKIFFELCSINNITFISGSDRCYGNCKCEKLLYITTRGMNIKTGDELEQATPYLKALSWLWEIKSMEVIARENFDYLPQKEIDLQIKSAIAEGLEKCKSF